MGRYLSHLNSTYKMVHIAVGIKPDLDLNNRVKPAVSFKLKWEKVGFDESFSIWQML